MSLTKVTSSAITDSAVTTAKIEDGTIVNADINASANIAQSKLSLSLPTISSISIEDSQGAIPPSDTSLYFDIIGTNFSNPSTVELLDSSTNASTNATTVTYVSATQLRVTASLSAGTYKIRVTRSDGFAGTSATALLTVSQAVSWSTSAGSLGTFDEGVAIDTITLSATSNSSVTYAIQSGSLPTGLSLNTSNGEITGTPGSVSADTTSTFTVRATDAESQYADREFTITVTDIVIQQSLRFNDDDTPSLSRTPSSAGNRKTWTWSGWYKQTKLGDQRTLFSAGTGTGTGRLCLQFHTDDKIRTDIGGTGEYNISNEVYRDVSAWYHIVWKFDTTQSTANDRSVIYINGSAINDANTRTFTQNTDYEINNTVVHKLGILTNSDAHILDGYLAEVHFIDGQALTPSSFGTTGSNGRWKPKTYSGTYGTNGFYLDFADSGNLGDDESGNTNDFTANNLAATDQVTDNPQNNFATMNSIASDTQQGGDATFSEGNLGIVTTYGGSLGSNYPQVYSTINASQGKWYFEMKMASSGNGAIGAYSPEQYAYELTSNPYGGYAPTGIIYTNSGEVRIDDGATAGFPTFTNGDILGCALDIDNNYVYFHKNGTYINSGDPTSGSSGTGGFAIPSDYIYGFTVAQDGASNSATMQVNFGNPVHSISSGNADQNEYGNFEYAPPSGYLSLCTNNLPEPTIKDSSEYFHTQLYTGNGSTQSITNDANSGDFQPDMVWIKNRDGTDNHVIYDSSRGVQQRLNPNTSDAEATKTNGLTSFDSDGFTVGSAAENNSNTADLVAWQWKANGGTTSSNTDGSITSTVQANTTAGFSIVTYTGNGTSGATIGHGLGVTPQMFFVRRRNLDEHWQIYSEEIGNTKYFQWTTDGTITGSNRWNDTSPTSSVFSVGNHASVNASSNTYVAYCFANIEGYSKFGSYTGNGSTDGTFIYTGFKPALIILKESSVSGDNWRIVDNKRLGYNENNYPMYPSASTGEGTEIVCDMLSNGFKLRSTGGGTNQSGSTFIYMAIAEAPFGGILTNEATAR